MNKNWRWLPAGIAPVIIVAASVSGSAVAEAQPQLPAKTAQELLEFVATSTDDAYSGTVEQTSDLGLPDIGMATPPGGRTSSDPTSTALELLTADHTARVYIDGPDNARVQVLDADVQIAGVRRRQAPHAVPPPFPTLGVGPCQTQRIEV